jgi:hypothetical protein
MLKHLFAPAMAIILGLPAAAGAAVTLRDLAGCKPGADDPVVTSTGLVTTHLVCDHLLLELPETIYGRDLLLNTEFAALSGGSNFIAPGTVVDNRVVRFVRRGKNKVDLVMVTYEIARAPVDWNAPSREFAPTTLDRSTSWGAAPKAKRSLTSRRDSSRSRRAGSRSGS